MEKDIDSKTIAATYVGFLRALALIHQNNHWQVHGENFYGNHLLFEKLQNNALAYSDSAAEKMIGRFNDVDVLNLEGQATFIAKMCIKFSPEKQEESGNKYVLSSMNAIKGFLKYSDYTYEHMKEEKILSLGLDDLIMEIHASNENDLYHLSQVLRAEKYKKVIGDS